MKSISSISSRIIAILEDRAVPLWCHVALFASAIVLRNSIELAVIGGVPPELRIEILLHYSLSYIMIYCAAVLLFSLTTKARPSASLRVVFASAILLLIAPLVDWAMRWPYRVSYLIVSDRLLLLRDLVTFFGPLDRPGVTPGMRTEIAVFLACAAVYFRHKKISAVRIAGGTAALYLLIFGFLTSPSYLMGRDDDFSRLFLLILIGALAPIAMLQCRDCVLLVLRNCRPYRCAHFLLMAAAGFALAHFLDLSRHHDAHWIVRYLLSSIAIACAWTTSVFVNDLFDVDADRVNSPHRPLAAGGADARTMLRIAAVLFGLTIMTSLGAGFVPFCILLTYCGVYQLYSAPPLRLKRVPMLSKLAVSGNSLLCALLGFHLAGAPLSEFPREIVLYFLIAFTLAANVIDLKDVAGDRQAGILTIPTLLSLPLAKVIIGLFVAGAIIAVRLIPGFDLPLWLLLPTAAISFALIVRTRYLEAPLMLVYLFVLCCVVGYLFAVGSGR